MNKSQMAKLAAAAGVNGLMYDPNAEGVFGNVQGYTVTIMPNANNRVYYTFRFRSRAWAWRRTPRISNRSRK